MTAPRVYTVKKGLDLPITGVPVQTIDAARPVGHLGVLTRDYVGLKPRLLVVASWLTAASPW